MNVKRFLTAGIYALVLLFGVWVAIADAQVRGAIFTTLYDGSAVNHNIYSAKEDVYLNGGPRPNAPCTAAGLPDGDYYFQVTNPSGSVLLSGDDIANRKVGVLGGIITAYLGTHSISKGLCGDITVQLSPYADTPNPGGEYKVWMTPVNYYNPGSGNHGFLPRYSKTDNFKVISESQSEGDSDGDGMPDIDDFCPTDPTNTCPPPSE
jgi:hypothetical protein